MQLKYVLLLVAVAVAEKQIKLEDIERDNLISERQVSAKPDIIVDDPSQQQNLQPPLQSSDVSYENSGESVSGPGDDIVYAQPGNNAEEYQSPPNQPEVQQQIQYVTPSQQDREYTRETSAYTPVHEASSHTYSAPARQSLINPIIHTPPGVPSPYLAQQPRFVYVQAGDQQLQTNGVLTYGKPQHSIEHAERQNAQDDIAYASIEQNQLLEQSQQSVHAPTPRPLYGPPVTQNYLQYVPLLAGNPSPQQNYIMIIRDLPGAAHTHPHAHAHAHTHTQAYAVPTVPTLHQYTPNGHVHIGANVPNSGEHGTPNQQLAVPQSTVSYATRPLEQTAVLHAPESTAIPAFQYIIPSGSQHLTTHALPLQLPQTLEYALQPPHPLEYHAHAHVPKPAHYLQPHYSQHYTPSLDLFGAFNKNPLSLLDSYIPSSVILARQRGLAGIAAAFGIGGGGGGAGRNLLHTIPQATHLYHQGSHQPGYNTIAYSTHQDYNGYAKRSPKFTKTNKKN